MEQITAQNMPQDLLTKLSATGGRTGRRSAATQGGGDPFLQIIQNMVAQTGSGQWEGEDAEDQKNALTDQSLLAGYAGMLFGAQGSLWDQSGETALSQADMLLQLTGLSQGTNRVQTVPEAVEQLLMKVVTPQTAAAVTQILNGELTQGAGKEQTPMQATGQTEVQESTQLPQQVLTMQRAQMVQAQEAAQSFPAVQTTAAGQASDKSSGETKPTARTVQSVNTSRTPEEMQTLQTEIRAVSSGRESGTQEQESLLDGQQKFRSAVAQAKQALEGQSRKEEKTTEDVTQTQLPPDIQKLQLESATAKLAEPKTTEAPRLLDQLTDGLTQELSQGKGEFTMKLKPEALGEITVKLTEKAGKMVLNITTASPQTAKLLNAELPALRETMRPMQVEVHEAVSQSAQSNQAQMQFNMSSQQFANQQRAFAWQQEKPYYAASDGLETAEEVVSNAPETVHSNLNLYV